MNRFLLKYAVLALGINMAFPCLASEEPPVVPPKKIADFRDFESYYNSLSRAEIKKKRHSLLLKAVLRNAPRTVKKSLLNKGASIEKISDRIVARRPNSGDELIRELEEIKAESDREYESWLAGRNSCWGGSGGTADDLGKYGPSIAGGVVSGTTSAVVGAAIACVIL